jgi:hypothetical protein
MAATGKGRRKTEFFFTEALPAYPPLSGLKQFFRICSTVITLWHENHHRLRLDDAIFLLWFFTRQHEGDLNPDPGQHPIEIKQNFFS